MPPKVDFSNHKAVMVLKSKLEQVLTIAYSPAMTQPIENANAEIAHLEKILAENTEEAAHAATGLQRMIDDAKRRRAEHESKRDAFLSQADLVCKELKDRHGVIIKINFGNNDDNSSAGNAPSQNGGAEPPAQPQQLSADDEAELEELKKTIVADNKKAVIISQELYAARRDLDDADFKYKMQSRVDGGGSEIISLTLAFSQLSQEKTEYIAHLQKLRDDVLRELAASVDKLKTSFGIIAVCKTAEELDASAAANAPPRTEEQRALDKEREAFEAEERRAEEARKAQQEEIQKLKGRIAENESFVDFMFNDLYSNKKKVETLSAELEQYRAKKAVQPEGEAAAAVRLDVLIANTERDLEAAKSNVVSIAESQESLLDVAKQMAERLSAEFNLPTVAVKSLDQIEKEAKARHEAEAKAAAAESTKAANANNANKKSSAATTNSSHGINVTGPSEEEVPYSEEEKTILSLIKQLNDIEQKCIVIAENIKADRQRIANLKKEKKEEGKEEKESAAAQISEAETAITKAIAERKNLLDGGKLMVMLLQAQYNVVVDLRTPEDFDALVA